MIGLVSDLLRYFIQIGVVLVLVVTGFIGVTAVGQGYSAQNVLLIVLVALVSIAWSFGMAAVLLEIKDRLDWLVQLAEREERAKRSAPPTAVRRERASTTKAVSSASQTDEEFRTRWKKGGRLLASHSTGPWGRALGMRCKLTQATIRSCIE